MAVTVVRTVSSSQIGSLLTQQSASTTYLTKTSASTTYVSKASPEFSFLAPIPVGITDIGTDGNGFASLNGYSNGNIFFNSTNASLLSVGEVFYATGSDGIDNIKFTVVSTTTNSVEGLDLFTAEVNAPLSNLSALQTWAIGYNVKTNGVMFFNATTGVFTDENVNITSSELANINGSSSNIQEQLNSKVSASSPTFTGTVTLPSTTSIGNVTSTEIGYIDGVTSAIQTQINSKANLSGASFTGNISTTGRITATAQPYFHVRSTSATTVGNDVLWGTIDSNSGSYYNANTGRFTAPVSGTYFFSAHGLYSNADAADMRVALYKNNGEVQGNRFILTKGASQWQTFYANDIIYLAANDYVTLRYIQGAGALHTDANYNGFRGWLLG